MKYIYEKPDNLVEWFESGVKRFSSNPLFGTKDSQGNYQWLNYGEIGQRVDWLRAAMASLGIEQGHKVAFIGNNRWEWAVSAFATFGRGARFVPMYESEKPAMWKYIIEHSEARLLIVSKPEIAEQIAALLGPESQLQHTIVIDVPPTHPKALARYLKEGVGPQVASVVPDAYDTAVLIYTSGTTGKPKGVLLSHGNLTHDARAGYLFYKQLLTENAVSLSILPWAHSYGQVAELYNWFQFGGRIGFMEKVETLGDDMMKVAPTFLLAVPRVFNKIYDGLHKKMAEAGGVKLKMFNWAVAVAEERAKQLDAGKVSGVTAFKYKLATKLVFSKIHARFGGRLEGALTASAMMNPAISRFFWNIGIPVVDAYGLTETSPALAMNKFEEFRAGSIGKPLKDVRIVIDKSVTGPNAPDGEIVAYGPIVMQGYYKDEAATRAVMTDDGGLRTGDLGRYDKDGFLFITGRIKEQYKLENGKYVYPASIEEDIKMLPYVDNAMVYGEGRPYNVALVVLDHAILVQWAAAAKLKSDVERLTHNPSIQEFIATEITAHLKEKYGNYEIPKRFIFIDELFSVENGMLTQTMKLKRKQVLENYREQIEALYK